MHRGDRKLSQGKRHEACVIFPAWFRNGGPGDFYNDGSGQMSVLVDISKQRWASKQEKPGELDPTGFRARTEKGEGLAQSLPYLAQTLLRKPMGK